MNENEVAQERELRRLRARCAALEAQLAENDQSVPGSPPAGEVRTLSLARCHDAEGLAAEAAGILCRVTGSDTACAFVRVPEEEEGGHRWHQVRPPGGGECDDECVASAPLRALFDRLGTFETFTAGEAELELGTDASDGWVLATPCSGNLPRPGLVVVLRRRARPFDGLEMMLVKGVAAHADETLRRIHLEQSLRSSEQRYRDMAERSPVGIFVHRAGILDYANQRLLDILGETRPISELVGRAVLEFVCPDDRPLVAERVRQRVLTRTLGDPYEVRFMRRDGSPVWVELRTSRTDEPNSEIPTVMGTVVDVSARRRAEEEREQLREQLFQAQRLEAVGRLAGGVAHDFNNILTGIVGYADLVHDALTPRDPLRGDIDEVRRAAHRAAWLTNQLLAFSRRQVVTPRVLRVETVVTDSQRMLSRVLGDDVRLLFSPAEETWPINVDPGQIDQILVNLGTNARDAMPGGGALEISTANVAVDDARARRTADAKVGDYVRIRVRDEGCGMDAATVEHAFEPFFSTKEVGQGTGLGLATVHGIVAQNEGFVEIHSEPGRGTTVDVHLPRTEAVEEEGEVAEEEEVAIERGAETILLVEDEQMVRRLARRILEHGGYRVLEAGDGREAMVVMSAAASEIDMVLTDVVMPNMDGRDFVESLREARPGMKALFVSGYAEDKVTHRSLLDDRTGFLPKPFAPDVLLRRVRDLLDAE